MRWPGTAASRPDRRRAVRRRVSLSTCDAAPPSSSVMDRSAASGLPNAVPRHAPGRRKAADGMVAAIISAAWLHVFLLTAHSRLALDWQSTVVAGVHREVLALSASVSKRDGVRAASHRAMLGISVGLVLETETQCHGGSSALQRRASAFARFSHGASSSLALDGHPDQRIDALGGFAIAAIARKAVHARRCRDRWTAGGRVASW